MSGQVSYSCSTKPRPLSFNGILTGPISRAALLMATFVLTGDAVLKEQNDDI